MHVSIWPRAMKQESERGEKRSFVQCVNFKSRETGQKNNFIWLFIVQAGESVFLSEKACVGRGGLMGKIPMRAPRSTHAFSYITPVYT